MPSLHRRKERGNRFRLHYVDVDGKRYRVDTGTTDKKIANLWKQKAEELLTLAKHGIIEEVGRIDIDIVAGRQKPQKKDNEGLTLEDYRQKYEDRCRDDLELARSTIENNNLAFRSLIAVIGNKSLGSITDEVIVVWKKVMLEQGKSRTTVGIYFRHLRAAFNRAVKWKLIEANPFLLVDEIREKRSNRKKKDMSSEEVRTVLQAIDQVEDHEFGKYVRFLLLTGCRRNEMLFLRWEGIDLERRNLNFYAEKTKREVEIPINKALMRVIRGMEIKEEGFVFRRRTQIV